jgi:hypothetical protein
LRYGLEGVVAPPHRTRDERCIRERAYGRGPHMAAYRFSEPLAGIWAITQFAHPLVYRAPARPKDGRAQQTDHAPSLLSCEKGCRDCIRRVGAGAPTLNAEHAVYITKVHR